MMKCSSMAGIKKLNGRMGVVPLWRPHYDAHEVKHAGRYGIGVSTSYPKGNRADGKNCAQRRSKKPTLIEGVQYH
jgi:hypothetical protein